jgi:hypothetical protein
MALLRNETQNNFTIIGNYILQNKNVSLKAIGMYAKIASLPDNWRFTEAGLVAICRDGKDAIKSSLQELEELNLLYRFRARGKNGTLGEAIYFISSHPMSEEEKQEIKGRYYPIDAIEIQQIVDNSELEPKSGFPMLDKPMLENPMLENPQQLNTNILNTNELNTKKSTRFIKPTLEEIENYITEKQLNVNAKQFYEYFETGNWVDSKGNKVKSWKQKLLTWNNHQNTSNKNEVGNRFFDTNDQYSNIEDFICR